jgi:putative transposase
MLSTQEQFEFIETYKTKYSVTVLLAIVDASKSGYYKWRKTKDLSSPINDREEKLTPLIHKVFYESKETYGKLRIQAALKVEHDLTVNHKCIARIMNKYGMVCQIRKKKRKRVKQPVGKHKNILDRQFEAKGPGEKFCIDITYVQVNKPSKRWVYLCAIKDLYHGEIVAYQISTRLDMNLVMDTLRQLKEKGFEKKAILHSDQGFHFTNPMYIRTVKEMGVTQSMSRRGNCWDNACIESFFGHLKSEMPCFGSPQTYEEVQKSISEYMTYYNEKRIQNKYGMSPVQYLAHAV